MTPDSKTRLTSNLTEIEDAQVVRSTAAHRNKKGPSPEERFEELYQEVGRITREGETQLEKIKDIGIEGRQTRAIAVFGFIVLLITVLGMVLDAFYHSQEMMIREREWRSTVDTQNAQTGLLLIEVRRLLEASQATATSKR